MYTSSEDAMGANEALDYGRAAHEIARHGQQCAPGHLPGTIIVLDVRSYEDGRREAEWITLPCRTRAILAWLGY